MERSPQEFWLNELGRADAFSRWVFEQARPHIGGAVLEIGCGSGTYTALLAESANKVVALDIDEAFVSKAKDATSHYEHVDVRLQDVTQSCPEGQFDTVFMLDVLEHIEDDQRLLSTLSRALRPGGKLILKVPAFSWLYGAMDTAVGHHRRYSSRTLEAALLGGGFTQPRIRHFNAAAIPGWWLNGVLLKRTTPPAAQLAAFERVLPVVKAIDRLASPFVGLSLLAIAEPHPAFERVA